METALPSTVTAVLPVTDTGILQNRFAMDRNEQGVVVRGGKSVMKRFLSLVLPLVIIAIAPTCARAEDGSHMFPANGAANVNPDTHLTLTFSAPPAIGHSGKIRIYDARDHSLVDTLDLSIPPSSSPNGRGPDVGGRTKAPPPPAPAGPEHPEFQSTLIGGAWFHFFPIIVHGDTATIYPHHGVLKYGHRYIIDVDASVLTTSAAKFQGISGDKTWTFSTKATAPDREATKFTVSARGDGDFSTVQGAVDFVPDHPARPVTIFVRKGNYEEIVYMNGKHDLLIRGENREGTVVGYPNNSAFNRTRPAFSVVDSDRIELSNFTINNYFIGQAEALLMDGEQNIVDHMTLNGSGDAFTTHGSIYMVDSQLTGDGDTILGYATLFCLRCTIRSVGPFTWTRTPEGQHGNIFVDSTFIYLDKPLPWSITKENPAGRRTPGVLARLPKNGPPGTPHANFPYAEMVLINCKTSGVPPIGWGPVEAQPEFDWSHLHLWEYNTTDTNGHLVDLSRRHAAAKVLKLPQDAAVVRHYSDPQWVFGGWQPKVRSAR